MHRPIAKSGLDPPVLPQPLGSDLPRRIRTPVTARTKQLTWLTPTSTKKTKGAASMAGICRY